MSTFDAKAATAKLNKLSVIQLQARIDAGKFEGEELELAKSLLEKRQSKTGTQPVTKATKVPATKEPAAPTEAKKEKKEKAPKAPKEPKEPKKRKGREISTEGKSHELRKMMLDADKEGVTKLTMGEMMRKIKEMGYVIYHSEAKRVADNLVAEGKIKSVRTKAPVEKKEKPAKATKGADAAE